MGVFRIRQGAVWFPNVTFRSASHWAAGITEDRVWLGFRFSKCTDELQSKNLMAENEKSPPRVLRAKAAVLNSRRTDDTTPVFRA